MNDVKAKVQHFLQDTLELKEQGESVKIVGITKVSNGWMAEAEVIEREPTLPGHRVFRTERYIIRLNQDLEVYSFRQQSSENQEDSDEL